jgi:hypothetical protein
VLATFERVAFFEAHTGPKPHERHWSEIIGGLDWSTTGYLATGGTRFLGEDMLKEDRSVIIWKIEEESAQKINNVFYVFANKAKRYSIW